MRRTLLLCAGAIALVSPLAACGDDDSSTEPTTPAEDVSATVTVHGKDTLKFDAEEYTAEAGTVEFEYVNDGSVNHTLLIKDVDDFKLNIGSEDKGTVELEPGTYTLYCDIAGHESAGMEAELTVS